MTTNTKRPLILLALVAGILVIPAVAMQFSAEVVWTGGDFIVAGLLLLSTVALIELLLRFVKNRLWRIALVGLVLFTLFIVWAELAVGLFGSPWAGS